jgi:hypothetical protein
MQERVRERQRAPFTGCALARSSCPAGQSPAVVVAEEPKGDVTPARGRASGLPRCRRSSTRRRASPASERTLTAYDGQTLWARWIDLWNGDLAQAEEIIHPEFAPHVALTRT